MLCTIRPQMRRRLASALVAALVLSAATDTAADDIDVGLASKIILKVLLLDKDLEAKTKNKIVIGVIGSDAAYEAFSALKGQPIDQDRAFTVVEVIRYTAPPSNGKRPTLLFVGSTARPEDVLPFTRKRKVISATNVAGFVERGVTVGVTVENNRPRVLLNLVGSEREGINWNPKILKIAKTIR
jgi:hypothetical protein